MHEAAEKGLLTGAVVPLYSPEEAGSCLYLGEFFAASMPALAAIGAEVEATKKS
jgi:hypothetical protein